MLSQQIFDGSILGKQIIDDLQSHFICPITQQTFQNPVITDDGHTFQRKIIQQWFSKSMTSPLTGLALDSKILRPNILLKRLIQNFYQKKLSFIIQMIIKTNQKMKIQIDQLKKNQYLNITQIQRLNDILLLKTSQIKQLAKHNNQLIEMKKVNELQQKQLKSKILEKEKLMEQLTQSLQQQMIGTKIKMQRLSKELQQWQNKSIQKQKQIQNQHTMRKENPKSVPCIKHDQSKSKSIKNGIYLQANLNFKWSHMKSDGIKIYGNIAKMTDMYGQCFAVIQSTLHQSMQNFAKNQKEIWAIKIKQVADWMALGICLNNKIIQDKYKFVNANQTGHGTYMISSDGRTYSHSDSKWNNARKSFRFSKSDTIYMQYDRTAQILRFRKNQSGKIIQLKVSSSVTDTYNPCINLCMYDDSVQLIQGKALG